MITHVFSAIKVMKKLAFTFSLNALSVKIVGTAFRLAGT
jgi:hypothetical protein